jgi:hypothetical protein
MVPSFLGPNFETVDHAHQDNFLFQAGVILQGRGNQHPPLGVAFAVLGAADKNALKPTHCIAFLGKTEYSVFYFGPLFHPVGKEAVVHARDHDEILAGAFDHIAKTGRDDNPPFWVNGMKGASPKHRSPFLSTLIHLL